MIITNNDMHICVAYTTFQYHAVTYSVDELLNFYILGDNGWHLIDANRVPDTVVEAYRTWL